MRDYKLMFSPSLWKLFLPIGPLTGLSLSVYVTRFDLCTRLSRFALIFAASQVAGMQVWTVSHISPLDELGSLSALTTAFDDRSSHWTSRGPFDDLENGGYLVVGVAGDEAVARATVRVVV